MRPLQTTRSSMVGQDEGAAFGDHYAPAVWELTVPAPHMVEVDASWCRLLAQPAHAALLGPCMPTLPCGLI
jgi:hypothetical protein